MNIHTCTIHLGWAIGIQKNVIAAFYTGSRVSDQIFKKRVMGRDIVYTILTGVACLAQCTGKYVADM